MHDSILECLDSEPASGNPLYIKIEETVRKRKDKIVYPFIVVEALSDSYFDVLQKILRVNSKCLFGSPGLRQRTNTVVGCQDDHHILQTDTAIDVRKELL